MGPADTAVAEALALGAAALTLALAVGAGASSCLHAARATSMYAARLTHDSRNSAPGAPDDAHADLAFDFDELPTRDLDPAYTKDDVLANALAERDHVAAAERSP